MSAPIANTAGPGPSEGMAPFTAADLIRAKRDGRKLTAPQIEWFIDEFTAAGDVSHEQAAAMAMAIYFRGLDHAELTAWTTSMVDSGNRLDLTSLGRPTVDKHSTGGVGDKISLILVPLVAACGAIVPQVSGRGLGHTGGTLDKLESIPGWRSILTVGDFRRQLASVGGAIVGASDDLAPADRKLYALRDLTATVESIPLIASSIMSKKIAEGTTALVLDVKVGSGAFMADKSRAKELARTMVELGEAHGVRTRALLTAMDDVLGRAVGNSLEVSEALDVLSGGGPRDVREVTLALASEMLDLVGISIDPAEVLDSGKALAVFTQLVASQGGDLTARLPTAQHRSMVTATRDGFVRRLAARPLGRAAWHLGAGRTSMTDAVSPAAGVLCLVGLGDVVAKGDPLLELHTDSPHQIEAVHALARDAVEIGDSARPPASLIIERVLPIGDHGGRSTHPDNAR